MKRDNVIQEKSYQFALDIKELYQYLSRDKKEYVISKQILKSGTSIGANIEEAIGGQSKRDFKAKINISYKEGRETLYWLILLRDRKLIPEDTSAKLIDKCLELNRIMASILKTLGNL